MIKLRLKTNPTEPSFYIIQDIQHLNEGSARSRSPNRSPVWCPPTDVYQTEEEIIVRVEIAGMREADFAILLDGRKLSIRGIRADVVERRAYHQMEIRFGEFRAEIELPVAVQAEGIEAIYRDGFLRIMLPKALPRKVEIE
jgi:HSP20 family molecular chaperone IbpA